MSSRPEFIPTEIFRQYIKPMRMNKYFRVDGIMPSSFIARHNLQGTPIKSMGGLYRPIAIVARARALTSPIERTIEEEIQYSIAESKAKLSRIKQELEYLTQKRDSIKHTHCIDEVSRELTGGDMLIEQEIIAYKTAYNAACGVYFLIENDRVVYVGQSINVYTRIYTHMKDRQRQFDSYTYIPCEADELDVLESLYIHSLAPLLQGRSTHGNLSAPYSLRQIVEMGKRKKYMRDDWKNYECSAVVV